MIRPFLWAAPLVLLTACATIAASPIEGPVRIGQTVYVDGPHVQPRQVIEDSRCPMNARCIWAGRVVLRAKVSGGSWSKTMDLTLGEPVQVADGKLTLVSVTPENEAGKPIKAGDYHFAFEFQGGL